MQKTTTSKNLHPVAEMYAEEHKAGHMDRREFMSRATALGVSATAAYGMLGLATPAQAGATYKRAEHFACKWKCAH